mmetsp:Transcript_139531/g.339000  ORF Transcript_139531/g.339000 Transcript_139531/m.339000 type:complete len:359 (+) Transcript_139531:274-1350(+)
MHRGRKSDQTNSRRRAPGDRRRRTCLIPQARIVHARDVALDHLLHERVDRRRVRVPLQRRPRLGRVADEEVDLRGAEVPLVHAHENLPRRDLDPDFVHALAFKLELHARSFEGAVDERSHRVRLPGRDDVIVRLVLLQHLPHALDVIARVAPIALRVHVSEVEALLLPGFDVRRRHRDLPRHERLSASRGLVVEQDAVAREHAVGLAVVNHRPVRHQLRDRVRRPRVKRRRLALRNLAHLAVELRRRCLVKLRGALLAGESHRLEEVERPDAVHLRGVHGHLERHLDVRLRREVVHLGRSHVAHDGHERVEVAQIAVVQVEVLAVRVIVVVQDVLQARVVVRRRSAFDPVHDVALREE